MTSFFSPASVDSSGSSGKRSSISGVRDVTSAELVSSVVSDVASLSLLGYGARSDVETELSLPVR